MQVTRDHQKLAYIWFCAAEQFFSAAKLLSTPELVEAHIKLPRLHLLCHGMEISMKAALLLEGANEEELRREYGHNLIKLWEDTRNANFRAVAGRLSLRVWEAAKESQQWKGKVLGTDPIGEFESGLRALSVQHDRTNDFAFRYPMSAQIDGWSPYFLIDVLMSVVIWYLRSPDDEDMDGYPSVPTFDFKVRGSA